MTQKETARIAVVIPKYGLVGGAEGFAAELTERLAADPHYDIHVFANRWSSQSGRITFHRVPMVTFPKFLTTLSFAWFAGIGIAREQFDLIHTHDRIFQADIFTLHGTPHRFWYREIRRKKLPSLYDLSTAWVEKKLIHDSRCSRLLAVSDLTRQLFLKEYGISAEKIEVIHPGVDLQPYLDLDQKKCRGEIRQELGIDQGTPVILFVSMNFEIKGLDRLMEALAVVRSRLPEENFKLLVVGKGNIHKYKDLAKHCGIEDEVLFYGIADRKTLPALYLAGDLYAMLSKFDTFAMVVLEAMAASLPVIISENVGARDLVRHGSNGFVVRAEDNLQKIADYLMILLNENKRNAMGKAARLTAQASTWEAVAAKVDNLYKKLLHGCQGDPS